MRWLDGIIDTMDVNLRKLQEIMKDRKPGVLQFTELQRVRHAKRLNDDHVTYESC